MGNIVDRGPFGDLQVLVDRASALGYPIYVMPGLLYGEAVIIDENAMALEELPPKLAVLVNGPTMMMIVDPGIDVWEGLRRWVAVTTERRITAAWEHIDRCVDGRWFAQSHPYSEAYLHHFHDDIFGPTASSDATSAPTR